MDGYSPGSSERGLAALEDPALGLSQRAKMQVLFAVMLGLFLGALDQTIVGPALPTIVTQLGGSEYYVWVVTAYLLTSTISIPFWGKLSDIHGRKPVFMIGIGIFLVGSALSGLSQTMGMLILFRGIQGIGAGSLFPVALAIIGAEQGNVAGMIELPAGPSAIQLALGFGARPAQALSAATAALHEPPSRSNGRPTQAGRTRTSPC